MHPIKQMHTCDSGVLCIGVLLVGRCTAMEPGRTPGACQQEDRHDLEHQHESAAELVVYRQPTLCSCSYGHIGLLTAPLAQVQVPGPFLHHPTDLTVTAGTPIQNNMLELYAILNMLDPGGTACMRCMPTSCILHTLYTLAVIAHCIHAFCALTCVAAVSQVPWVRHCPNQPFQHMTARA